MEKFMWAVRVWNGEIEKWRCEVKNKEQNKFLVVGLFGSEQEIWIDNEYGYANFYAVDEEDLDSFLKNELKKRIADCRMIINTEKEYIDEYEKELAKFD